MTFVDQFDARIRKLVPDALFVYVSPSGYSDEVDVDVRYERGSKRAVIDKSDIAALNRCDDAQLLKFLVSRGLV